jgi:hypothetical protein
MLTRTAIVSLCLLLFAVAPSDAADRDYLERGEPEVSSDYDVRYDRAVRRLLGRGWQGDVVLRMFNRKPSDPEWVAGIARKAGGYRAFSVETSHQLSRALDPAWGRERMIPLRSVRPVLRERALSESTAARTAALWRHVLSDPANYGKEPAIHLHSDRYAFYVGFLPRERLAAHTVGGGAKVDQLFELAIALASYAAGDSERALMQVIRSAERKFGI